MRKDTEWSLREIARATSYNLARVQEWDSGIKKNLLIPARAAKIISKRVDELDNARRLEELLASRSTMEELIKNRDQCFEFLKSSEREHEQTRALLKESQSNTKQNHIVIKSLMLYIETKEIK